jgi:hypothetical protein
MESNHQQEVNQIKAVKVCLCTVIVIFLTPLMVCDLYYGFSGDECLDEYPEQIHLNLKKYLLVCGFLSLFNMIYMIISTSLISQNDEMNTIIMVINVGVSFSMGVLLLVWNIIGAIIFWQFIFPEHSCNESLTNYLFTSIIIKLVITWVSFASRKNDD